MPDIATIGAILSSLKTATDIAKFLRESDLSLERAELKLKLADLVGALAEAKIKLVEIQETLSEKDKKISELEDAFQSKEELIRHLDAYYFKNENGIPTGNPYCLRCWESGHIRCQLVNVPGNWKAKVCTKCGQSYDSRCTGVLTSQDNENKE